MPKRRPRKSRLSTDLTVDRLAATMPGVSSRSIKMDLGRLNLLRRTDPRKKWQVRQSTAKGLFEERVSDRTKKMDIFPTEAGVAKLWELYEAGELTLKSGHLPPNQNATPPVEADLAEPPDSHRQN